MMISDWIPIPSWLIVILLVSATIYIFAAWPYTLGKQVDIAGPPPQLFFGTLKDEGVKGSVKCDMEWMDKYGMVFCTWTGRVPLINVSDPEIIKEIFMKDFANFINKPMSIQVDEIQQQAITMIKDDHWKFVRSILTPTFSSGKLRNMASIIGDCIERFIDRTRTAAEDGESIDVITLYNPLTMDVIAATAFGVEVDSQNNPNDPFVSHANAAFDSLKKIKPGIIIQIFFPFLRPILRHFKSCTLCLDPDYFFYRYLSAIIEQRKQEQSQIYKDFLQLMLSARIEDIGKAKDENNPGVNREVLSSICSKRKDKGLTDIEIMAQSLTFLLAGFETTATLLSYASYCLATNPDVQSKLIDEIDEVLNGEQPTHDNIQRLQYLDMCLNEALRMYPPAVKIMRLCKDERIMKGFRFPAGVGVSVNVYALHHSPEFWPEPDKYDPERFSPENKAGRDPYTFIPFAAGPRNCIGMRFALMEAKMTMATLFQRFRLAVSADTEIPLSLKGTILLGIQPIKLKVEKR